MSANFTRRTENTFQHFQYQINNSVLPRSKLVKDLGVLFDEKLRFDIHVRAMIARASKLMGFICGSILEYGSTIWNPYYHTYTNIIENVQRKFTRILQICYKFRIPYNDYGDRLCKLNMTAPFYRRLYFDELLLYKIVSYKLNTNLNSLFTFHTPNRFTR